MTEAVAVLTYKSAESIIDAGGSQAWALAPKRVRKCQYLICARHRYGPYRTQGPEEHRHAFLIAKVDGVVRVNGMPRYKILFKEYALIDGPEVPFVGSNPVQYFGGKSSRSLDILGIDFDNLVWRSVEEKSPMDRAKEMLSEAYRVPKESIRIQIEM